MDGFWANKRVCVTGGAGFLGSHLLEELGRRGATDVFVPEYPAYDLVQRESIIRMLDDARPDVVIHLAAVVGGIGANMANPGRYFYENAMMGIQLIEESRKAGVGKFVAIGTICAYPKFTPVPFREDELWNGYPEETNAPYGLAKKMMLVQCQAYRQQYGFDGIFLLPVNLYGPRDNFDLETSHVIPAMIRKFVAGRDEGTPVVLWGDGSPTREFLFVEDAARAIAMATESYDGADPVNLGSAMEITIRDLAALIAKHVGYTGEIVWDTTKPNGQPRRKLDVSRARERFGFEAQVPFDEGIQRTVEWWEAACGGHHERVRG
jgi:GDP-L-fucose synthase